MFAVAGIETMEGLGVSIDPPHTWMALQASINRLGIGWGASGGVCLIVVTGVNKPSQLNGFQTGGKDFTVALGENWDKIAKAGGAAKKFAPLINAIMKIGAKTPKALKAALKANPDEYGDLLEGGAAVSGSHGLAPWKSSMCRGTVIALLGGVAEDLCHIMV